ncbi:helix-turn-helix domain-containing protein [Flavobacterium sp. JAS]|uniref:helix-turn-helix domain-containing protein n=1 Tax=Flavobacterium sp. JAS TaxID=2897329 RepID=UPI001E4BC508|nr:helix-turn-helix transcriptional regulator [Flavobacterium sp. JAS]MCD0470274.1 helix-turn-helix domain-containing protein [Flavobacterium sp. JAS]
MNRIIGNKLKILRRAKNLSQEEVADFLEISQSSYARMERGESTSWANHFNKICEVFEITPEDLVKKETEALIDEESLDEIGMFNVYRRTIKQYELQIEDLKTIIRHLNTGKN